MTKAHLVKVYKEAASFVAENNDVPSCFAISYAKGEDRAGAWTMPEVSLYRDVTRIDWYCARAWNDSDDRKECRVLNLLLMAEWVKTDYEAQQKAVG